jgi:transposase-like protein
MEDFSLPAVIRKILKTTKYSDMVYIKTKRLDKLRDHFDNDDPEKAKIFDKAMFEGLETEEDNPNLLKDFFEITFELHAFESKSHLH